jgi:hypothetical protein
VLGSQASDHVPPVQLDEGAFVNLEEEDRQVQSLGVFAISHHREKHGTRDPSLVLDEHVVAFSTAVK